jgi:hypothetical protein
VGERADKGHDRQTVKVGITYSILEEECFERWTSADTTLREMRRLAEAEAATLVPANAVGVEVTIEVVGGTSGKVQYALGHLLDSGDEVK